MEMKALTLLLLITSTAFSQEWTYPELLSDVVDEIIIEGDTYILDAYVYRDMMPIVALKRSDNLNFICRLINVSGKEIPQYIDVVWCFAFYGDKLFFQQFSDHRLPSGTSVIHKMVSHYLPGWNIGEWIHVVVLVKNNKTGEKHYLRKECVRIDVTY
jgi:hypothetical protein